MGRKWNEIVQLPEWQTPLGKLAFVVGLEVECAFKTELQRAYPACFSPEGEQDEGVVPWSAVEVKELSIVGENSPAGVTMDTLECVPLEFEVFALSSEAAKHHDALELPSGRYAFRTEFELDSLVYVVVTDGSVYNDGAICAVRKDSVNWDA